MAEREGLTRTVHGTRVFDPPSKNDDVQNGFLAGISRRCFGRCVYLYLSERKRPMTPDFLNITDLLLTNGVLLWLGLRLVKRIDDLDQRVDSHESRLQLTEHQLKQRG